MTTINGFKSVRSLFILLLLSITTACSSFKGTELNYEKIPTSSLNKTIEYGVYTPPNWTIEERLPLVMFLHGARDSHNTIEQYQAHKLFDEQINAGKMPRFVLVTPNGDTSFCNRTLHFFVFFHIGVIRVLFVNVDCTLLFHAT